MNAPLTKGALPYKSFPVDEGRWNGPLEVRRAEISDLRIMSAWVDPENDDIKQGYKLPHHRAETKHVVRRAVFAAMAALFGARSRLRIPTSDRRPVYNHLAKHYTNDLDVEPPEFKAYSERELKSVFSWVYELSSAEWEELTGLKDMPDPRPHWETKHTIAGVIDIELEIKADVSQRILEGFASIANNVDDGGDLIESGAYTKTLKKRGSRLVHLWNHDRMHPFAKPEQVEDVPKGLKFMSRVANTPLGDEMLELHATKIIRGASIGYLMNPKDYTIHNDENPGSKGQRRTIHQVSELWEYSSVTFPMNAKAGITRVKDLHPRDAFAMWLVNQELMTGDVFDGSVRAKLLEMGNLLIELARSTDDGDSEEEPSAEDVAFEKGASELLSQIDDMKDFFAGIGAT